MTTPAPGAGLLSVWFWEMAEDMYNGRSDCTCRPRDKCPFHRVASWLEKHGSKHMREVARSVRGWPERAK